MGVGGGGGVVWLVVWVWLVWCGWGWWCVADAVPHAPAAAPPASDTDAVPSAPDAVPRGHTSEYTKVKQRSDRISNAHQQHHRGKVAAKP